MRNFILKLVGLLVFSKTSFCFLYCTRLREICRKQKELEKYIPSGIREVEIKLPCDNWFIVEQNHRRFCRSHSLLCDVAPQTWHWNLLNWQRGRPPMANPLFLRENWRFVPKFLFKSGISYCIVEILKTALCSNSMGYMHSVLANQVADIFTPNDKMLDNGLLL